MNDSEQPLDMGEGHAFKPNGLGDFDLHCPTGGKVGMFPYMTARITTEGVCPACSKHLKRVEADPANQRDHCAMCGSPWVNLPGYSTSASYVVGPHEVAFNVCYNCMRGPLFAFIRQHREADPLITETMVEPTYIG